MSNFRNLAAGLSLCCSLVLSTRVAAEVLISYPLTNDWTLGQGISQNQSVAVGFQISTQSYALASVMLNLVMSQTGALTATIYSGSGNRPVTPLIDLNVPEFSQQYERSNFVFTPKVAAILDANTRYWLMLQTTNGVFGWYGTGPYTGTGATYVGSGTLAADGSNTWYPYTNNPAFSIQVEGLPVGIAPGLEIRTAIELRWPTLVGKTYQIQWSSEAASTNWSNLGEAFIGDGLPKSVLESTASGSRFYRLQSY